MSEIKGYKDLTEDQVNKINTLKSLGEALIHFILKLEESDSRWKAIALTDIEKGCMSAVRSICDFVVVVNND